MAVGSLIILNGPSCSGKTTIARALQESLDAPYFYVGLDSFEEMQSRKGGRRMHMFYGQAADGSWHPERDLVHVMHQCVALFAAGGMDVVVEHIFLQRRWLRDAVLRWSDYPALFVGVRCAREELVRREREREGQNPSSGQAERQLNELAPLDRLALYDVVVDTGTMSVEACVRQIERSLAARPDPAAFRRLKASPFLDEPTA